MSCQDLLMFKMAFFTAGKDQYELGNLLWREEICEG